MESMAVLAQKTITNKKEIVVRLLWAPPVIGNDSVYHCYYKRADGYVDLFWKELEDVLKKKEDHKLKVLATWHAGSIQWNHSKIIAVDGKRIFVGGHNMWSEDYLYKSPVSDISMIFAGPVVKAAHAFLDNLWTDFCWLEEVSGSFGMYYHTTRAIPESDVPCKEKKPTVVSGSINMETSESDPVDGHIQAPVVALGERPRLEALNLEFLLYIVQDVRDPPQGGDPHLADIEPLDL